MPIITISRGTFAGGQQLADLLSKRLGFRCVSREMLYETVQQTYGITAEDISEIMEQAPTHLEHARERSDRLSLGQTRRRLFYALQASLCELLHSSDVIYHGQAGHLLLPGVQHVLCVRLIARRGQRINMAMERDRISKVAASKLVDQVDSERQRWTRSFYGVDWGDPALFDMVLNLDDLSIDDAVEITAHAAALPSYRVSEASSRAFADLCLSSAVMAELLSQPQTIKLDIHEVMADGGTVKIVGNLNPSQRQEARRVAEQVQGVKGFEIVES